MSSSVLGYVVCGIGVVLIVIGVFWAVVIGYYPEYVPLLLGLLLVGVGAAWGGQRMLQAVRRQSVEHEIALRDAKDR